LFLPQVNWEMDIGKEVEVEMYKYLRVSSSKAIFSQKP
jgi:hypothetical protein